MDSKIRNRNGREYKNTMIACYLECAGAKVERIAFFSGLTITSAMVVLTVFCALVETSQASETAHVAVLSDMEDMSDWDGPCEATDDASQGKSAMLVRMGKGGDFNIRFKDFEKKGIKLGDYDIIKFDYKMTGGRMTVDHVIRQWPFLGGFMLEYYPLKDTFVYPSEWTGKVVNLWEAENIRGGFDREKQLFELRINAVADKDDVRLYLDNVRFVKRLLSVECDVDDRFLDFGERIDKPDGSLRYRYDLKVQNRSAKQETVRLSFDAPRLKQFVLSTAPVERTVAGGTTDIFSVEINLTAAARKALKPLYQETCGVKFEIPGVPDSDYRLELMPAVPYKLPGHPCLAATSAQFKQAREWIKKWGWAKQCAENITKRADTAMGYDTNLPEAKPCAEESGDRVCPQCQEKTELYTKTDARSLNRFQCLTCGKMLSPKFRMAKSGPYMAHWADYAPPANQPIGNNFASTAREGTIIDLGLAWQLTGDKKYAGKAAEFFRSCLKVVPDYPVVSISAHPLLGAKGGSQVGYLFQEFDWCEAMMDTLDLIWDSGCLSDQERRDFLCKVMRPMLYNRLRLENYMVHRLSQSIGGYALLADDAPLAAFVVEGHYGLREYLAAHMRSDGFCYMAAQYAEPVMSTVLPALRRYDNASLELYSDSLRKFFTVWYEWTDPDGNTPDLGDSSWTNYRNGLSYFEQGYAKFHDPRMAIPLQENLHTKWQRTPGLNWEDIARSVLLYGAENIPRGKPDMSKPSRNYDDYGLLIFNQGEGDKRLWLALPYGKPMGHGHPDKLHFEWWGLGQKMSKKGGGCARGPSARWWKHPLMHNTLLVDQRSQQNVAGAVEYFQGEGQIQGALVVHDGMYPGTTIQRMVMLYDGLIFFFDRLESREGKHTYDFVYRNAGRQQTQAKVVPSGPLGNERNESTSYMGDFTGYAVLTDIRCGSLSSPLNVEWDVLKAGEDARVRLWQDSSPEDPAEIILASGPFDMRWGELSAKPDAVYTKEAPLPNDKKEQYRGSMMIVRRTGQAAAFFTFLEACRMAPRVTKVEPLKLMLDGRPVASRDGVAYRLTVGQTEHLVMMCPVSGVKEYGGIRTKAFFNATNMGLTQ